MSTAEYQMKIGDVLERLKSEAPNIALRMAQTGLTLVKERSIRDGISVNGSFADYSSKEVYTSSFKKQTLNQAGQAYIEKNKKGNWAGLRKAQGRESDHVNLFYRGRTWTSLHISAQTQIGYRYSVLVSPSDEESTQIFLGNLKRYGNFLALTESEQVRLQEDVTQDVQDLIVELL